MRLTNRPARGQKTVGASEANATKSSATATRPRQASKAMGAMTGPEAFGAEVARHAAQARPSPTTHIANAALDLRARADGASPGGSEGEVVRPRLHSKARYQRAKQYPPRLFVSDAQVPWTSPAPGYAPTYFVDPSVLDNDQTTNPNGWADPEAIALVTHGFASAEGPVCTDAQGYPLNPCGRTGLRGRGLLGAYGRNKTADPIVTRLNPTTGDLEMLAIKRVDTSEWAIPGGFVDSKDERVSATLGRELKEETGIKLDMSNGIEVYRGYVDDPRNTDNAWIETVVTVRHLSADEAAKLFPKANDDATDVKWVSIGNGAPDLYASHTSFANAAAQALRDKGLVG